MLKKAIAIALALTLAAPTFAATPDANAVIVAQGGQTLTLADIDAYMQRVPEDKRGGMMDSGPRVEQVLLGLLTQKQLAKEARDLGLDKDAQVGKQIELAVIEILARERMKRFTADIKLPDFEAMAKEKYLTNKQDYVLPGRIDVQHVLVSTKSRGDEAARARAQEVLTKAKADPASFDKLVEEYSDDPSKSSNQGLIPNVVAGSYAERFVEVAKGLKQIGEISEVARTPFGYHVLKLVKHDADRQREYAEVHDEILKALRADYITKQEQGHVDQLRNSKLDVTPELVGELRTRYLLENAASPVDADGQKAGKTK